MSSVVEKIYDEKDACIVVTIQGAVEASVITTVADVAGSLGAGEGENEISLLTAGADTAGSLSNLGTKEVSSVDTIADVNGSLGGLICEISKVITVADVAGSLNNKLFLINSKTVGYYVWFNVNSAGVDPALGGRTGVEVALATSATAAQVATAVHDALEALGAGAVFSATIAEDDEITIVHLASGVVLNNTEAGNSGFTVETLQEGAAPVEATYFTINSKTVGYYVWINMGGVDPAVAGRTGVPVVVSQNATAAQIATAIHDALEALGGGSSAVFGVTVANDDELTITHTVRGACTDVGAGTSGFAVGVDTPGTNTAAAKYFTINSPTVNYYVWFNVNSEGIDPAVSGKTGIEVPLSLSDNAAAVAAALNTALEAVGGGAGSTIFSVAVDTADLTITHVAKGECVDIAAGTSGFTVSVDTQGEDVESAKYFLISSNTTDYYVWFNVSSAGGDPVVASRTGIEVAISSDATAAQVATAIKTALNLVNSGADFLAEDDEDEVTVVNKVYGIATDVGAGTSGFTVSVTTQGTGLEDGQISETEISEDCIGALIQVQNSSGILTEVTGLLEVKFVPRVLTDGVVTAKAKVTVENISGEGFSGKFIIDAVA